MYDWPETNPDLKLLEMSKTTKELLEAWDKLKDVEVNHYHLSVGVELVNLFERQKDFCGLRKFITSLTPDLYALLRGNQLFLQALMQLHRHDGDHSEVIRLLRNGTFHRTAGLLDLWDQSHYSLIERQKRRPLTSLDRFRIRKRFPPPPSICPEGERPSHRPTPQALDKLRIWLDQHRRMPYPTAEEIQMLVSASGLSQNQVRMWFANARRRLRKDVTERDKTSLVVNPSAETVSSSQTDLRENKFKIKIPQLKSTPTAHDLTDTCKQTINEGSRNKTLEPNEKQETLLKDKAAMTMGNNTAQIMDTKSITMTNALSRNKSTDGQSSSDLPRDANDSFAPMRNDCSATLISHDSVSGLVNVGSETCIAYPRNTLCVEMITLQEDTPALETDNNDVIRVLSNPQTASCATQCSTRSLHRKRAKAGRQNKKFHPRKNSWNDGRKKKKSTGKIQKGDGQGLYTKWSSTNTLHYTQADPHNPWDPLLASNNIRVLLDVCRSSTEGTATQPPVTEHVGSHPQFIRQSHTCSIMAAEGCFPPNVSLVSPSHINSDYRMPKQTNAGISELNPFSLQNSGYAAFLSQSPTPAWPKFSDFLTTSGAGQSPQQSCHQWSEVDNMQMSMPRELIHRLPSSHVLPDHSSNLQETSLQPLVQRGVEMFSHETRHCSSVNLHTRQKTSSSPSLGLLQCNRQKVFTTTNFPMQSTDYLGNLTQRNPVTFCLPTPVSGQQKLLHVTNSLQSLRGPSRQENLTVPNAVPNRSTYTLNSQSPHPGQPNQLQFEESRQSPPNLPLPRTRAHEGGQGFSGATCCTQMRDMPNFETSPIEDEQDLSLTSDDE